MIDDDLMDDPRVLEIVLEYQRELERGQRPDRQRYLRRHPELSDVVAECLESLELLHRGASDINSKSGARFQPMSSADTFALPTAAPMGDFQIVGEIARGGMGIVYEAIQLSLGRRVALKVLPFAATVDPRHLRRFKIEAQAAALLHHNHIVPIYAVGCERGVHYYAMQLIEGQSLALVIQQLRAKEGRLGVKPPSSHVLNGDIPATAADYDLSPSSDSRALPSTADISAAVTAGNTTTSEGYIRRAARLMIEAAEALEHAHQSGVVHRDIKPANLLVDDLGKLWITDFGLAQLQSEQGVTRSSDMLGTFRYMSPEQAEGQRALLDHRTDIYSLGATFFELLTLEPVFSATSHQDLFYQILHTDPRHPHEVNRAIPTELDTIILKALSKNPADRYSTAADFAADVQRYLDHQPITARPPTILDRSRKWVRRHPAFVVAGVLSLAVIAVASLVTASMVTLEQRKTEEEQEKTKAALAGQQLRAEDAERHFQQARQAVDTLFQISEEELTDRSAESARKRILEVVLSYYETFIEERSGDKISQGELAAVQDQVKGILHELNVLQRAIDRRLLGNPVLQPELKLSETQSTDLKAMVDRWRNEEHAFTDEARGLSEEARRSRLVAQAEQRESELATLLAPWQIQRFRQITIQSRGISAFKDRDVIKTLSLTPPQRAKIRDIEREMFTSFFRPPPDPRRESPGAPRRPPSEKTDSERERPRPQRPDPSAPERGESKKDDKQGLPGPPRREGDPKRDDKKERPPEQRPEQRHRTRDWVEKAIATLTPEQIKLWRQLVGEPFTGLDNPFPPSFHP